MVLKVARAEKGFFVLVWKRWSAPSVRTVSVVWRG